MNIQDVDITTALTVAEDILRDASNAYYNGTPHLPDAEFDRLWREHESNRKLMPDNPVWKDTILDRVGARPDPGSGFRKQRHSVPMLSLDNCFVLEDGTAPELDAWYGSDAVRGHRVLIEPKADGLSLSLIYRSGRFYAAVTRGDGETGEVVTENVRACGMVPDVFDHEGPQVELRGEVVIPFNTFEAVNERLREAGAKEFSNPRNAAAGILRRKDPSQVAGWGLEFYFHSMPLQPDTNYTAVKRSLEISGFQVLPHLTAPLGVSAVHDFVRSQRFPTDGAVFKLDSMDACLALGTTSRAPRWARALKFQQEEVETTCTGIRVQVGRSGALTPVADFEPVEVDGSVVAKASLHNEAQVNRLGLQVGDTVAVRKAAGVIPELKMSLTHREVWTKHKKAVYASLGQGHGKANAEVDAMVEPLVAAERPPFDLVKHIGGKCPSCGSTDLTWGKAEPEGQDTRRIAIASRQIGKTETVMRSMEAAKEEAARLYCGNTAGCPAQLAGRIEHMASRKKLNIDQLGGKVCDAIAEGAYCQHPFELFSYPAEFFASLNWETESGGRMTFGESRAAVVVKSMAAAKQLPLNRWISALGIHTIGDNTPKEITRLVRNVEALTYSCTHPKGIFRWMIDSFEGDGVDYKRIKERYGVSHHLGPVSLRHLVDFVCDDVNQGWLRLIPEGVVSDNYNPEPPKAAEGPLSGKKLVVTGTLSVPRTEIEKLITDAGGTVSGSISKSTDYLVAGEKAGSKLKKAGDLQVPVVTEETLREMLG